jgi:Putative DNA-binding domain
MRSIAEIREHAKRAINQNCCDSTIIKILYNNGEFFFQEDALWDYKKFVGIEGIGPNDDYYKYKICDISKDIVSFYNSSGGYIIFGVDNNDKKIVGTTVALPIDHLAQRIKSDTGGKIDFTAFSETIGTAKLQIIFVPPRSPEKYPIDFKRESKKDKNGKTCYKVGDIYYRDDDASVPAVGASLVHLISNSKLGEVQRLTDHNLPARDSGFNRFVGRREELDSLWRWFLDPFNNTRLVAGIGGVGKTTLVREFVEEVLATSPANIEKIVWLSAKKISFNAEQNKSQKINGDNKNLAPRCFKWAAGPAFD